jgi:hypothetical protein
VLSDRSGSRTIEHENWPRVARTLSFFGRGDLFDTELSDGNTGVKITGLPKETKKPPSAKVAYHRGFFEKDIRRQGNVLVCVQVVLAGDARTGNGLQQRHF